MDYTNKTGKDMTLDEIISRGKSILNKTFREIYPELGSENKGGLGQFIEKHVYNYEPNSMAEPDFVSANAELKVTPVRKLKNGNYSAKERLVLNIIDYEKEAMKDFYTSSFWTKNALLYILFYLYEEDKHKLDYLILKDILLDFKSMQKDLAIIKHDWEIIHNKIIQGKAHEISEADTMYLAACTKGVNSESMRTQFNSDIPAKQRAYSLKTSYMTEVFNRTPMNPALDLLVDILELEKKSFEDIINDRLLPYIGKTLNELKQIFEIDSDAKNVNELLVSAMLGLKNTKVSKTEEFKKANIVPKTIRIEKDGSIKEHMSFNTFEFTKIIEETWEDSELKDYFESTRFMFVIFKNNGFDYVFDGVKFWNMPIYDIEVELKEVWLKTVEVIRSGNIITKIGTKIHNNLPKATQNRVAHVRPKAKNSNDEFPLPVIDNLTKKASFTKQCFWLNKSYIKDLLAV